MTLIKLKDQQDSSRSVQHSKVASRKMSVSLTRKQKVKRQNDLPKLELIHSQRLSSHLIDLIDVLTEAQQDWICLLQRDWGVDMCTFNLLSSGSNAILPKHKAQTIDEIIPSIHQTQYQPMMIGQQMHWVYTCCFQIVGLGRVRIVIDFNSTQFTDHPVIFATNRLDWSSRKILTQWFQRRPPTSFNEENLPEILLEAFYPR
jgi:hypothetical protein